MVAVPCTDKKDGRGDIERPEADAQMGPNVDEVFLFRIVLLEPNISGSTEGSEASMTPRGNPR